jgi:hypothetical protein
MIYRMEPKMRQEELIDLIPWYLNGTLPPNEHSIIEAWIASDPIAQNEIDTWRLIVSGVTRQRQVVPSDEIWEKLKEQIHSGVKSVPFVTNGWLSWGLGLLLASIVLIALWLIVRPGVVLRWSISGEIPTKFQVFRSPVGSSNLELIGEIKTSPGILNYQFVDGLTLPGRTYVYHVEGVGSSGVIGISQSVLGNPLSVLPGQVAILITSLVFGSIVVLAIKSWPKVIIPRFGGLIA